jgi:hypothetical protein
MTIEVVDVPMVLADASLDAKFSFALDDTAAGAWADTLELAIQRVLNAFFASGTEGAALLDAVRTGIPAANQAQFDSLRKQNNWDTTTTNLINQSGSPMHARAALWLSQAKLDAIGPLTVHVVGTKTSAAIVTPSAFGSLSASAASLTSSGNFTWTADSDDTLHLSGAIDFPSTPFVGQMADVHARAYNPLATDCASAVALGIGVANIANTLVQSSAQKVLYGSCDATCAADALRSAIASTWSSAVASPSGGGDQVHFTIVASGRADVDDTATATAVEKGGAWIGQASGPGVPSTFTLNGSMDPLTP